MKCKVLFFAAAADAIGSREIELIAPVNISVGEAFELLESKHSGLSDLRGICAFAIDQKICSTETLLTDGCTLALLPPVSGG
ncbi:MAG: MoaD/ThiS family protein [Phycisphaerales bacterium]|nr:MoaD/ThiS family protein [Phycisphaerales bacterium]